MSAFLEISIQFVLLVLLSAFAKYALAIGMQTELANFSTYTEAVQALPTPIHSPIGSSAPPLFHICLLSLLYCCMQVIVFHDKNFVFLKLVNLELCSM